MRKNIPLSKPYFTDELGEIENVLKSGWLAHGDFNKMFEKAFALRHETKHAITMNSCASALQIALEVQEWDPNKNEVIVPSFTWSASANAIVAAGYKPVFCDVEWYTGNVTANHIKPHITKHTRAIMVVHFAGQPCVMKPIMDLAEEYGLIVIEDSAETIGAFYDGEYAGNMSHIGCFSFFPTKNMTTGEGGMLITNNDLIADKARTMISHGMERKKPHYKETITKGYNFRMSNLNAAIGYSQFKKLSKMNDMRKKIEDVYDEKLIDYVQIPIVKTDHVYQMYNIRVEFDRDKIVSKLNKKGIGASVHFDPPVHKHPFYNHDVVLPNAERLSKQIISLPMYCDMTEEEINYVVDGVIECFDGE